MSLAQTTVIVFARAPVPGRCKTRLIGRYGARGAARLHRQLTLQTLRTVGSLRAGAVELWCEPSTLHGFFHRARRRFGVKLGSQPRGDLGRKMALALQRALDRGAKQVLIVGTDCAVLCAQDLRDAADALKTADYVVQPAEDGGYVLIGARRVSAAALRGIAWSSGRELEQTRGRLRQLGLSWRELPTRWDVDLPRDVRRARRLGLL